MLAFAGVSCLVGAISLVINVPLTIFQGLEDEGRLCLVHLAFTVLSALLVANTIIISKIL